MTRPPYTIIQVTCCMNCMYHMQEKLSDWCTLNDDITIPDGFCIGYESEEVDGK